MDGTRGLARVNDDRLSRFVLCNSTVQFEAQSNEVLTAAPLRCSSTGRREPATVREETYQRIERIKGAECWFKSGIKRIEVLEVLNEV